MNIIAAEHEIVLPAPPAWVRITALVIGVVLLTGIVVLARRRGKRPPPLPKDRS